MYYTLQLMWDNVQFINFVYCPITKELPVFYLLVVPLTAYGFNLPTTTMTFGLAVRRGQRTGQYRRRRALTHSILTAKKVVFSFIFINFQV